MVLTCGQGQGLRRRVPAKQTGWLRGVSNKGSVESSVTWQKDAQTVVHYIRHADTRMKENTATEAVFELYEINTTLTSIQ